jgi:hypothetical protein
MSQGIDRNGSSPAFVNHRTSGYAGFLAARFRVGVRCFFFFTFFFFTRSL